MINSNRIIKRYTQWLNENLMAEAGEVGAAAAAASPNAGNLDKETKFNFNFESGKYKQEEIPEAELTKLKNDLNVPIGLVKMPRYMNQKTVLTLTASTSTLGLSANLRQQLQNEGFKPTGNGNDALCAARLKTIEAITIEYFCEKLKCTPQELATKITINKVSKANSGSGNTDEERKKFSNFLMIRYGSSVNGSTDLQHFYLVATNERLNNKKKKRIILNCSLYQRRFIA